MDWEPSDGKLLTRDRIASLNSSNLSLNPPKEMEISEVPNPMSKKRLAHYGKTQMIENGSLKRKESKELSPQHRIRFLRCKSPRSIHQINCQQETTKTILHMMSDSRTPLAEERERGKGKFRYNLALGTSSLMKCLWKALKKKKNNNLLDDMET